MNVTVTAIVAFAAGTGAGYFIGHRIAAGKAQRLADQQVEDTKKALKSYYENKLNDVKVEENKDEEQIEIDMGVDPGINDEPKITKPAVEDPRERFPRITPPLQPGVSDVMKRPKDLPPTAIDTPDGYPDPEDKKAPPYLIREKDYGELDDWDTLELILWKCGTVSTDDSTCEMVSPTLLLRLLPENWPNMFNWDPSGKYVDTLYFRNNAERRDIQIIKDNRTYREYIEEVWPGRLDELDEG